MADPRYFSTRDPKRRTVSFEEALLAGLAPDGGLYVPDSVPGLDPDWREAGGFPQLAVRVLRPWLADEVPDTTLQTLVKDALDFPAPVVRLADNLWVLELFCGPTLSFKDFGARLMARLMGYFLAKRGERLTILAATSGDTGSAVADGFSGQGNLEVVLLYPKGRVSPVQQRQLIVRRPGVRTFAVEGTFDDCQRLVKEAFGDTRLKSVPLSSANSINIGRLLPQMLYYLWAAAQVENPSQSSLISPPQPPLVRGAAGSAGREDDLPPASPDRGSGEAGRGMGGEAIFCVPSGNLGNLTGGVLANRMGLPVKRFLAAHNANDFFPDYLHKLAEPFAFKPIVATISNAMDVGAPSNFERLHALLAGDIFEKIRGFSVSDAVTEERMRLVYAQSGYVACPHTAVGLEAAARYRAETGDDTPIITLATAHPAKFPEVVQKALGVRPIAPERLSKLWRRETAVATLAPSLEALREVLV